MDAARASDGIGEGLGEARGVFARAFANVQDVSLLAHAARRAAARADAARARYVAGSRGDPPT